MKTIKFLFLYSTIWLTTLLSANAQGVIFDLTLNRQDSTITYRVANHTGVKLIIVRSIMGLDEIMKGSFCYISYRDEKGKLYFKYLSVIKKTFDLRSEDEFKIDINISEYMRYQIISIEGWLGGGYHPLGEFERRKVRERRTIKY